MQDISSGGPSCASQIDLLDTPDLSDLRRYHPYFALDQAKPVLAFVSAKTPTLHARQMARRSCILSEARAMIDERGSTGFSVRALADKCEMSVQTVYNIAGSREDIIRQAIEEHFRTVIDYANHDGDILQYFRSMSAIFSYWSRESPSYLRNLSLEYCSYVDPTFTTIHDIIIGSISKRLSTLPLRGNPLQSEIEQIARSIHAQMAFAALEWSNFRCDEHEFERRLDSCIRNFIVPLLKTHSRETQQ